MILPLCAGSAYSGALKIHLAILKYVRPPVQKWSVPASGSRSIQKQNAVLSFTPRGEMVPLKKHRLTKSRVFFTLEQACYALRVCRRPGVSCTTFPTCRLKYNPITNPDGDRHAGPSVADTRAAVRTVQMPEKRRCSFRALKEPVHVVAGKTDLLFRDRGLLGVFLFIRYTPGPVLMPPMAVVHNSSTILRIM